MNKGFVLCLALLVLASFVFADSPDKPDPVKPKFEKHPGFLVMGIEAKNALEGETMMQLWKEFFQIQPEIPEPVGGNIFGITYYGEDYDPETMTGYSYLVGMEVAGEVKLPDGLVMHKVPEGFYAVFEHQGKIDKINATYEYIFGEWLPSSGYKSAPQDVFEVYGEGFSPDSEGSVMEIWVPLELPQERPE